MCKWIVDVLILFVFRYLILALISMGFWGFVRAHENVIWITLGIVGVFLALELPEIWRCIKEEWDNQGHKR